MTINDLKRLTEEEARELIEGIVWKHGPTCPHCGNCDQDRIVRIQANKAKRIRAGLRRCKECRKQFTVTMGTLFEGSHLPLRTWVYLLASMCNGRKGVAARQLQRDIRKMSESGEYGNYRNIWFACHRLRYAMADEGVTELLGGEGKVIEMDETFLGGKPRRPGQLWGKGGRYGKIIVLSLLERGGKSRTAVAKDVGHRTLREHLLTYGDTRSRLMTDNYNGYTWPGSLFTSHETTNHTRGEYARGDVHSNTAESLFAVVKLSYRAIHHGYSHAHAFRYLSERDWVWSTKHLSDAERVLLTIDKTVGKRLYYKAPKNDRRKGGSLLGGQPTNPEAPTQAAD